MHPSGSYCILVSLGGILDRGSAAATLVWPLDNRVRDGSVGYWIALEDAFDLCNEFQGALNTSLIVVLLTLRERPCEFLN